MVRRAPARSGGGDRRSGAHVGASGGHVGAEHQDQVVVGRLVVGRRPGADVDHIEGGLSVTGSGPFEEPFAGTTLDVPVDGQGASVCPNEVAMTAT
jgi:hypothetical protein